MCSCLLLLIVPSLALSSCLVLLGFSCLGPRGSVCQLAYAHQPYGISISCKFTAHPTSPPAQCLQATQHAGKRTLHADSPCQQRMSPEGGDKGGQHGAPLGLVPVLRPPLMDIWLFSGAQGDNMRVLHHFWGSSGGSSTKLECLKALPTCPYSFGK